MQTIRVCFRRITLVSREAAERITIDYDLRFEGDPHRQAGLLPDYAIVETKAGSGLGRADLVLRALGIRPVRISKYVAGVGLLSDHVPNELRPLVRRHFRCQTERRRRLQPRLKAEAMLERARVAGVTEEGREPEELLGRLQQRVVVEVRPRAGSRPASTG